MIVKVKFSFGGRDGVSVFTLSKAAAAITKTKQDAVLRYLAERYDIPRSAITLLSVEKV